MDNDRHFKARGENVIIYPWARIVNVDKIEIGDSTRIDDFVFMNGGEGIKIGRFVHIASFTSIIGGGRLEIGDYVSLACGTRIITGTNTYKEGLRMSASLPIEQQGIHRGHIIIEKDAFIGTNAVIHPDITIGEGAVIGSNSLVIKDVEPWSINIGNPCRKMGERPRVTMPDI